MPTKGPLDRVAEAAGRAGSLLFVVIVVITAYEVIMRYAFGAPTVWVHEITVLLAASAFVLGGPAAHAGRAHIAITVLLERFPERWRLSIRIFNSLLAIAFLALLTYAAADQAGTSIRDMETSGTALNLPSPVILKSLFALASLALVLQTVGHVLADIERLRRGAGRP